MTPYRISWEFWRKLHDHNTLSTKDIFFAHKLTGTRQGERPCLCCLAKLHHFSSAGKQWIFTENYATRFTSEQRWEKLATRWNRTHWQGNLIRKTTWNCKKPTRNHYTSAVRCRSPVKNWELFTLFPVSELRGNSSSLEQENPHHFAPQGFWCFRVVWLAVLSTG